MAGRSCGLRQLDQQVGAKLGETPEFQALQVRRQVEFFASLKLCQAAALRVIQRGRAQRLIRLQARQ
ncbi:hypothetical protein D3C77_767640 [compost metagenome]